MISTITHEVTQSLYVRLAVVQRPDRLGVLRSDCRLRSDEEASQGRNARQSEASARVHRTLAKSRSCCKRHSGVVSCSLRLRKQSSEARREVQAPYLWTNASETN